MSRVTNRSPHYFTAASAATAPTTTTITLFFAHFGAFVVIIILSYCVHSVTYTTYTNTFTLLGFYITHGTHNGSTIDIIYYIQFETWLNTGT